MASPNTSFEDKDSRRLHYELEQAIKVMNHDRIGAAAGEVTKQALLDVAQTVACLRARYLSKVLRLGTPGTDEEAGTGAALELKRLREAYAEALSGYEALEHALERGYITLSK
jgi:hypothetical protein